MNNIQASLNRYYDALPHGMGKQAVRSFVVGTIINSVLSENISQGVMGGLAIGIASLITNASMPIFKKYNSDNGWETASQRLTRQFAMLAMCNTLILKPYLRVSLPVTLIMGIHLLKNIMSNFPHTPMTTVSYI